MTSFVEVRRDLMVTHRQRFVRDVMRLAGGDVRMLWVPKLADASRTVTADEIGNPMTWNAAPVYTVLGKGAAAAFDGTNTFATIPDKNNFSVGDGTLDHAYSIVALLNITDTAATKVVIKKNSEWEMRVLSTEVMQIFNTDTSSAGIGGRTSSTALSAATWLLAVFTYNGAGGATAGNGALIYVNGTLQGAAINDANYVASEPSSQLLGIGVQPVSTTPFAGSMGLLGLFGGVLNATQVREIKNRINAFYGLTL